MKTNMLKTPLKMKKWYIVAFAAALVIRVVVAIPLVHDWDGFVFSESAKNMLHGITPYETVEENDAYIYPNSDSPMLQQWYAYPPLPLLMFTFPYFIAELSGIDLTPVLENVVLKSPFIFGDLLFAFLVFIFLCNKSVKSAEHAMLLVLFNPLLIWVSSAWGMFDIWILNFILLFLISLRARAFVLAGFFLALAPEVKLFAVFFLPAPHHSNHSKNVTTHPSFLSPSGAGIHLINLHQPPIGWMILLVILSSSESANPSFLRKQESIWQACMNCQPDGFLLSQE